MYLALGCLFLILGVTSHGLAGVLYCLSAVMFVLAGAISRR